MADDRNWHPDRVLVGYDGSSGGREAVALAETLASADTEFVLVDVIPPVGLFTMRPRRLEDDEPPQSRGFFDDALHTLRGRRVETRTYLANSAAATLTKIAEEEDVDLIAIGPCYPGIVGRILLGSTGQGLMHGAAAPVAAAPRGYSERLRPGLGLIAVAYDGSPEAREAVAHAATLARRERAPLRLVTVDVRVADFPGVIGWEPLAPKSPQKILDEGVAAAAAEWPDLEISGRVIDGGSIPAALAADSTSDVDLLVVGSRGYGTLGRVLVGSVATGLLHRARCPVLVVPRPKAELRSDTDGEPAFAAKDAQA
jgi:nucleotide-binding universal stress UspA family protein